ncbi:MAG: hypothetical protein FIB08_01010 [Candidatus Methanoperedens sp.]|nr:hypothetical protein [Candidatus Methanoperedens sp.]
MFKAKSKRHLFSWDEIKIDNPRFLKFLRNFDINETALSIEKIDNDRIINIFSENKHLLLSLDNERTKAILKIDDFREIEYAAKKENGKLNIYPKPKVNDLIDRWILPVNKYHFKIWVNSTNDVYYHPSIGIGLGTISKPNIFSYAMLNDISVQRFENALKESIDNYKNIKIINNTKDRKILWERKIEVDKLKKISIILSVVQNEEKKSINLMLNSKAFLYTDLYPEDIDWILTTISIAKNNLEDMHNHEAK